MTDVAHIAVRQFRAADAPALAAIFHAAIHQIARRHYSAAQVAAWSPAPPDPARYVARGGGGRTLLVAVDDADAPIAYGNVERNGHIDHLFCRPDHAGTGVTAALYAALEAAARRQGITRLFVEASEPARRFFMRQGFAEIARREFALGRVAIHNYAMEKRLA